jgi:outer membrane cobalamin receptor
VPAHSGTGYVDLHYKAWQFTANLQSAGYRFTSPENSRWLDPYNLVYLTAGKYIKAGPYRIQLLGKINNITNQAYQTMQYWAMPGRHYSCSLRLFYH